MSNSFEILLAVLGVVAAGASATAAWLALRVSRSAFAWQQRQAAPRIQVSARTDERIPTLIFLYVENIGAAPAYEISFSSSRDLPQRAWGLGDVDRAKIETMDTGPIINGIPALAAGDSRRIMWGQYGGLYAWFGDGFARVVARYKDENQKEHESLSLLEVASFETTDASNNHPDRKMARSLETIASCLSDASNGHRPFVVESPNLRRSSQVARVRTGVDPRKVNLVMKQVKDGQDANNS